MRSQQLTLATLEELRTGILSGKRIELPSAQRQYLEKASPLIGEVSFDARHRPVSTNVTRHFKHMSTIAENVKVKFHAFMMLKKSAAPSKAGPGALVVVVDADSKLSLFDFEGTELLEAFDLGHGSSPITRLALSQGTENHLVITVDEGGTIRVHTLKIIAKRDQKAKKKQKGVDEEELSAKPQLTVNTTFNVQFVLPNSGSGEARPITAVLPLERGSQTYFITADALGGIAVFFRNGTMKGRVRVTEDPGGVSGLLRSQGQTVLFFSSHSFGFFSATQIDVQSPPCSGWNVPLRDVAIDSVGSSGRIILALDDGDVVVYSTTQGKSKTCDLSLKFPHVSGLPFKLHALRGHIMALPSPDPETPNKADYVRDVFFFNMAAMTAGYGSSPSRALALQASFQPKQAQSIIVAPGDRSKSYVAIKFEGEDGLHLYELNLKQAAAAVAVSEEGGGLSGWLNWFPKIGVFGIALVGVVIWNVRKATSQQKDTTKMDDLDDHLAKLRERRKGPNGGGGGLRERAPDLGGDDDD